MRLLILGLIACLAGGALCAYQAWTYVPPSLECKEPIVELGNVGQGQKLTATFRLTNRFPSPIEIKDIHRGCACSSAEVSEKNLQPGQETTLTVIWSTGAQRGEQKISADVIFVIDNKLSIKTVAVRGYVDPDIHYAPNELQFAFGQDGVQILRLSPGRLAKLEVKRVYCSHRAFKAEWHPEKSEVVVRYTTKEDPNDATGEYKLGIESNSVGQPTMYVPLKQRPPIAGGQ